MILLLSVEKDKVILGFVGGGGGGNMVLVVSVKGVSVLPLDSVVDNEGTSLDKFPPSSVDIFYTTIYISST